MKTYRLALKMVREIAAINRCIERRDADLARQLRRASMSVPLNISEGMYSRGKNRSVRLSNAVASASQGSHPMMRNTTQPAPARTPVAAGSVRSHFMGRDNLAQRIRIRS